MKTKKDRSVVQGASGPKALRFSRDGRVQQEIEDYLAALNSYPAQFARDPDISFEQHMFSVAMEHLASDTDVRRTSSNPHN